MTMRSFTSLPDRNKLDRLQPALTTDAMAGYFGPRIFGPKRNVWDYIYPFSILSQLFILELLPKVFHVE